MVAIAVVDAQSSKQSLWSITWMEN
jgi:hypothetical protein